MTIYLVVFFISTALFAISDRVKRKQSNYLDMIAIATLCMVAGLRAAEIGTDTKGYFRPIIETARCSTNYISFLGGSFQKYAWRIEYIKDYDIGFVTIIYLFEKITHSTIIIQFIIEAFVVLPVYVALKRSREIPTWLGMLVFCGMFYNPSLNMIRQSIAMSFNLLSTQLWFEGNKRNSIIFAIIATLFHKTAIVIVLLLFLYDYVNRSRDNSLKMVGIIIKKENINVLLAVLGGLAVVALTGLLEYVLSVFGLSRFLQYISGDIRFMPHQVISRLPPVILMIVGFKGVDESKRNGRFYVLMLVYEIIMAQFTSVNQYSGRMGQYFAIYSVISYPLFAIYSKHKHLVVAGLISYVVFYWWFYYCYIGAHETIPYVSMFAG